MKGIVVSAALAACLVAPCVGFAQSQASSDSELAKVQAIMQRSHQLQDQKRSEVSQQQQVTKAQKNFIGSIIDSTKNNERQQFVDQSTTSASSTKQPPGVDQVQPTIPNDASKVKALESQITNLTQANTMFQQQTDQRIDVLNQEHTILQGKVSKVSQVLAMLDQEVSQLGQQISVAQRQLDSGEAGTPSKAISASGQIDWAQKIEHIAPIQYVLYAILAMLVIIILMLIPRRGKPRMQKVAAEATGAANDNVADTKDEYDFMGSEEAIPAKLDLARAYVAMEDYTLAKKVLKQVMDVGNEEQRHEAKAMLDKIPRK